MNLVVSFLDGYVDSGARVADLDRITWDVDYLKGYRQRIADENEWAAELWLVDDSIEPAHSDHIFNADHRNRVDFFVCVTDDPDHQRTDGDARSQRIQRRAGVSGKLAHVLDTNH